MAADTAKRTGRKRKDPLRLKRDKAGRILATAERDQSGGTRQAQAQRFRQLGAKGVLDPRLGSTLGLMFVLHVPVKIGPQEYDAASWLADRLKALDDIVLDLRRSPPSSSGEGGGGGMRLNALELQALRGKGKSDVAIDEEATRMIEHANAIKRDVDRCRTAMGGGALGDRRWAALLACCRDEGLATKDDVRFAVEAMVELAWSGGFYEVKRRKARNAKAAWGHDVASVEIIRVVEGGKTDGKKS